MDDLPINTILYGFANRALEPFCYGCAGCLVFYRLIGSWQAKVWVVLVSVMAFLWMDDIWPAMASRAAKMGLATTNVGMAEAFSDNRVIGNAQFQTGEQSMVWDAFHLTAWDVGFGVVFASLGLHVSLRLSNRVWGERPDAMSSHQKPS